MNEHTATALAYGIYRLLGLAVAYLEAHTLPLF